MSLALVLLLVVVFGLLVPVLAQLGTGEQRRHATSSRTSGSTRSRPRARSRPRSPGGPGTHGRAGQRRLPRLRDAAPGEQRSVRSRSQCRGFAGSGQLQDGPNTPTYALLATGTGDAETGIDLDGNGTVRTDGPLWSNSGPGAAIALHAGVRLDNREDLVGGVGTCSGVDARPTRPRCSATAGRWCGTRPTSDAAWASSVQRLADVPTASMPADPCRPSRRAASTRSSPAPTATCPDSTGWRGGECGPTWCSGCGPARATRSAASSSTSTSSMPIARRGGSWTRSSWAARPRVGTRPRRPSQVDAVRGPSPTAPSCNQGRHGVELVFGDAQPDRPQGAGRRSSCARSAGRRPRWARRSRLRPQDRVDTTEASTVVASPTGDRAVGDGRPVTWPPTVPTPGRSTSEDCGGDGAVRPGQLDGRRAHRPQAAQGVIALSVPYPVPEGVRLDELRIEVVAPESSGRRRPRRPEARASDGLPATRHLRRPRRPTSAGAGIRHATTAPRLRADRARRRATTSPPPSSPRTRTGTAPVPPSSSTASRWTPTSLRPALRPRRAAVVPETATAATRLQPLHRRARRRGERRSHLGTVHAPHARIAPTSAGTDAFRFARGAVLRSFPGMTSRPTRRSAVLPAEPELVRGPVRGRSRRSSTARSPVLRARVYFCESLSPTAVGTTAADAAAAPPDHDLDRRPTGTRSGFSGREGLATGTSSGSGRRRTSPTPGRRRRSRRPHP